MAIIQIRNAAGSKTEREEEPKRDLMTKRSHLRVVADKDRMLLECGRRNKSVVEMAKHNERYANFLIAKQKRLTYYIGAITFLVGGGLGWLMN